MADETLRTLGPLTLIPPGSREVIDGNRATEIIDHWKSVLEAHIEKLDAGSIASNDADSTVPTNEGGSMILCNKIDLSGKSYTSDAAELLASFFLDDKYSIAKHVTVANLSDIIASRMEEEGLIVLKTICDAFLNSKLVEVDLSDNAMGSKGIKACSAVLDHQASTLQSLRLVNMGLSAETMEEIADILTNSPSQDGAEVSCIAANLRRIHFFNNMSGYGGCEAFARILSKCSSRNLTDIRFSATRAGRDGSLLVGSALQSLTEGANGGALLNLTNLDLADNVFGLDGGEALATVLAGCVNLRTLNLRDCMLEDDASTKICHALWSASAPLVSLDFSGNDIGYRGGKAIADLVEEVAGSSLKVLRCEENELTSRGVRKIARALACAAEEIGDDGDEPSCSVEEIHLGQNECGAIGAKALIASAATLKKNLKTLSLDANMFPEDVVEELRMTFGEDILGDMEENDPDGDADEDMGSDEEDDDDQEGGNDVGHEENADVDELTKAVGNVKIDNFC